jgi:hypothetical protein
MSSLPRRLPTLLAILCLAATALTAQEAPNRAGEQPRAVAIGGHGLVERGQGSAGEGPWRGFPISLSLREAPLLEVLRAFAQIAGFNLVLDPRVPNEPVTVELKDVPWDQALQVILKTHGLAAEVDGRLWLIEPPEQPRSAAPKLVRPGPKLARENAELSPRTASPARQCKSGCEAAQACSLGRKPEEPSPTLLLPSPEGATAALPRQLPSPPSGLPDVLGPLVPGARAPGYMPLPLRGRITDAPGCSNPALPGQPPLLDLSMAWSSATRCPVPLPKPARCGGASQRRGGRPAERVPGTSLKA